MNLDEALNAQQCLRGLGIRLDFQPAASTDLQRILKECPDLLRLTAEIKPGGVARTNIEISGGGPLIDLHVLRCRNVDPKVTPFPQSKSVRVAILQTGSVFYFVDPAEPLDGNHLLTPETTLTDSIASDITSDGPHLLVMERALDWTITNFTLLRHLKALDVDSWHQALRALEEQVFSLEAVHRFELCHKPVRELLGSASSLQSRSLAEYDFTGPQDLDKPLADCMLPEKAARSGDVDPGHALAQLNRQGGASIRLKTFALPLQDEKRLKQKLLVTKERIKKLGLIPGRWSGFSEIDDIVPVGSKRFLLLDANGFSFLFEPAASISAEQIQATCCIPSNLLNFPPRDYPHSRGLWLKREIEQLLSLEPHEDPFGLGADFLAGQTTHQNTHPREIEGIDSHEQRFFFHYLCHRLRPLLQPTPAEIVALRNQHRPPYCVEDVLRITPMPPAYYWPSSQEDEVVRKFWPKADSVAQIIRVLSTDQTFLRWANEASSELAKL